jgi:hypothetical protein
VEQGSSVVQEPLEVGSAEHGPVFLHRGNDALDMIYGVVNMRIPVITIAASTHSIGLRSMSTAPATVRIDTDMFIDIAFGYIGAVFCRGPPTTFSRIRLLTPDNLMSNM